MALRIQIAKFKIHQIPTESQFAKFNACQIFPLYGMLMLCQVPICLGIEVLRHSAGSVGMYDHTYVIP